MTNSTWKALGLIGIGLMTQNYISRKPKKDSSFFKGLGEATVRALFHPPIHQTKYSVPKVSYETKNNKPIYDDIYLSSEESCKQFKTMISDLFDAQGGYITVLQYMNIAGKDTRPEQSNYGWTSLNGFNYRYTFDGWLVKMPWPVPLD